MSDDGGNNFRPKTPEELEDQILDVSGELGEYIAPDIEGAIVKKDLTEIQKKFSARYKIYLETLRDKKTGREISPQEKARRTGVIRALNNLDRYLNTHEKDEKNRTLRQRQINVFSDLRDYLEEGGTEGYVKLPTGAGKTVIFSEFIEATNLKTLIVVPSTILVTQTEEKLQTFAKDLDVGKIYKDAKEHGHHVTIITYQSLVEGLENGKIKPEDYQMVILDEAHRALSEKRSGAINKFNQHIKIGFTATPRFSDEKELSDLLNTEIHGMSIREAVEEGVMCPFSVMIANTEVDISNVQISGGDYAEKELAKAINIQSRNQAAVDLYKQQFSQETAIAYCCGVDHAKNLADLFNKSGVSAAVIHGNQSTTEQQQLLEKYEKGEILVLCNADILIEGFDEPRASVCLNLRPTASPVVAEQRGGRVLRLNKNNPNKFATIVDFIDQNNNKKNTQITFAQIAEAAYLEGVKNSAIQISPEQNEPVKKVAIKINGLNVIVDPEEIMRIVRTLDEQKYKSAPAGWKTYAEIAEEIKKPETTVRRVTYKNKNTHPEYFCVYLNEKKKVSEYLSPDYAKAVIEQYKGIEDAPPDWKTASALAFAIGKSYTSVKAIAENERGSHPDWFKKYYSSKKRIDEHYSPELCEHIMKILAEYAEAPKDWVTVTALAKKTDKANATIAKIAEKYRAKNPDWFKTYLNIKGRPFEHFAPALAEKIEAEVNAYEEAPEGWMPLGRLATQVGKDEKQTKRAVDEYRESNPEWFHDYYNLAGGISEHCAPELVAIVVKKFESIKPPPADWMNATQAARETKMGYRMFKIMVEKYKTEFPDQFGLFQSTKKDPIEFYSPKIVALVKAEKEKQKEAPEGWITMGKIIEQTKRTQATVLAAMEKYRGSNPEWFGMYYNSSGNEYEHYSPELVQKLVIELTTIKVEDNNGGTEAEQRVPVEIAPEGWMTIAALRKKLHRADETVKQAVEKYRTDHPEWFKIYKPQIGPITEHYAPELIAIIEKDLSTHEVAPEGWKTISALQDERGKQNFKKIREISDRYRESNPEWFKEYIDARKQVSEHLAPPLVKIVKDELEKMETAMKEVESWSTSTSLVESAGSAQQTIQRAAEKYRAGHPEWFKDIKSAKVTRTYYHPDLAAILISEFKQYEAAPSGWMTANELMKSSNTTNFYRIKETAEKYRQSNPDWFKKYKPLRGSPTEYYAPELCQKILDTIKS